MASGAGQVGRGLLAAIGFATSWACAHGAALRGVAQGPSLGAGSYAVESIRSRAVLDGQEQLLEIDERGTRMVDGSGSEHVLTERGALLLASGGTCRLALAVSVDGEQPGVSDRSCTWSVEGDRFLLGDGAGGGLRTIYRVARLGERLVLEGLVDIDQDGHVVGDAAGERIVLVEGRFAPALQPVERPLRPSRPREPRVVSDI